MSELINIARSRTDFRWQLFASVSAATLIAVACGTGPAFADNQSDDPTVWIELGGQLERNDSGEERFAPPFILATSRPTPETISPLKIERPPRYGTGAEGKISFEPHGSDWVFSGSLRFGRANGGKHVHQQSYANVPHFTFGSHVYTVAPRAAEFMDTKTRYQENSTVLDFQAGRDVGLGMFGGSAKSLLSFGVRFAQFTRKSNITFGSDPDFHFEFRYFTGVGSIPVAQGYHSNAAHLTSDRTFHGIGPTLSWKASDPLIGNPDHGELSVDWGIGGGILFGRQKASGHHQTTALYHPTAVYRIQRTSAYPRHSIDFARSRSVIVPNVNGFGGLSVRYSNAELSFGYRADFFFGAMDGGIDQRKSEDVGFHGPFATISLGIGG